MIAIIPAKACSKRVPEKNYRPFAGGLSLVDLCVLKLLKVLPAGSVYLSCEDASKAAVAEDWRINFLPRDIRLADNATSMANYVQGISAGVPGDDDVLWAQVIDPLFDAYADVLGTWETVRDNHDSLVVVRPFKEYILDQNFRPIGFGFGPWHVVSQQLPTMHRLTFGCAVLSREAIAKAGYMVGANPYWMPIPGRAVDIDTMEDFELAQVLYERAVA